MKESFGERLERLRGARSLRQFAEHLSDVPGVTRIPKTTYTSWETEARRPQGRRAGDLWRALEGVGLAEEVLALKLLSTEPKVPRQASAA